jgi:GDSL-like Lipase/Acylhydrolase family/N-terminus of Esterase_SGNH_hydro-type
MARETRVRSVAIGLLVLMAAVIAAAQDAIDPSKGKGEADDPTLWYDIRLLGVEGQGWKDTDEPLDRLPAKAKGVVRDAVWDLGRDSSGLCVRFVTDATKIQARWTVRSSRLSMPHMAATGVSGLDLYAKTDDGRWRWLAVGQPKEFPTNSAVLVNGLPTGKREYLLYLPLYNSTKSVEIGIPREKMIAKGAPRVDSKKPIVFYGTSITQGGCASRPGMVHTSIVGRWLDYPIINLGFSGNGRMEPEMATLLAELDPAVYVLDCLPNMNAREVETRVEPFVHTLRAAHPNTPILLVEDRNYTNGFLVASQRKHNDENHVALHAAYERLKAAGVGGLSYLPGEKLLADDDGEDTVDGSHPTDLGFFHQATAFAAALKPLLAN